MRSISVDTALDSVSDSPIDSEFETGRGTALDVRPAIKQSERSDDALVRSKARIEASLLTRLHVCSIAPAHRHIPRRMKCVKFQFFEFLAANAQACNQTERANARVKCSVLTRLHARITTPARRHVPRRMKHAKFQFFEFSASQRTGLQSNRKSDHPTR